MRICLKKLCSTDFHEAMWVFLKKYAEKEADQKLFNSSLFGEFCNQLLYEITRNGSVVDLCTH